MSIVFILLGALSVSLFLVSKLGLGHPPVEHLSAEVTPMAKSSISREEVKLAA
jgi:hypothetical protein